MNRTSTVYHGTDVIETTEIEVTWDDVRAARNRALLESDWRALKDVTLTTAWRDYRSALRNLPQNHSESYDAADNWPVMPDE